MGTALEGGRGGWRVRHISWGLGVGEGSVSIEPAIRNGYLPYPWGRYWSVGSWIQGGGEVSEVKRL